jgi:hypothetical protein
MRHPFKVGGRYRNRDGEYEVVKIDGSKMEIRYSDGQCIETTVQLQATIRANMQAESAAQDARARAAAAHKTRGPSRCRPTSKANDFEGLVDGDFKRGIAGTTWRARLGRLIVRELSAETGQDFKSHPIYPQAIVHIARPECYHNERKRGSREAKFVLQLDAEGALYGLYIERNSGPMDETWHWPNLMAALAQDEALQKKTLAAMRRLGLEWEVYAPEALVAQVAAGEAGLVWRPAEGDEEAIAWPELVQRLSEIDEGTWCNLYLCTRLGKTEAIAAGADIAKRAVAVYRELLPLYEAAVTNGG